MNGARKDLGLSLWSAWLAMAVLTTVVLCGCEQPKVADKLRTDFVALQYIKAAQEAVASEPVEAAQAVHNLGRAVALAPANRIVLDRAGHLYVAVGAYKQAIPVLEEARRLSSNSYYYELGTCYLHAGEQQRGLTYLERAVWLAYQNKKVNKLGYALICNNVGYTYAEARVRLKRAEQLIEQALQIDSLNPSFIDSLGWVYFQQGDLHNAAFYLERAVRQSLDQPNAELHYHLGVVYARQKRREEAARQFQRVLQLRPSYPEVTRELRRLHWELAPPWHAHLPHSRSL